MELFEFKDTFCVSVFRESNHNTSLKPNLLNEIFQHSFKIECKFTAKNNGKTQWIFSKQGIQNSGVYIDGNKLYFVIATSSNDIDFSDGSGGFTFDFEYDKEYDISYSMNVEKKEFIVSVNGEVRILHMMHKVSDYSNVPLWIGTSNPFVKQKNYFNGIISKFEIKNNQGVITDLDFSNINRFKVWDKSGNGNFAYIEEFMNRNLQIRINKQLIGNSLEPKDIQNINKTLI